MVEVNEPFNQSNGIARTAALAGSRSLRGAPLIVLVPAVHTSPPRSPPLQVAKTGFLIVLLTPGLQAMKNAWHVGVPETKAL